MSQAKGKSVYYIVVNCARTQMFHSKPKLYGLWFVSLEVRWNTQSILLDILQKMPIKRGFLRHVFLFLIQVWKEKGFSGTDTGPRLLRNLIVLHREPDSHSEKSTFSLQFLHIWKSLSCTLWKTILCKFLFSWMNIPGSFHLFSYTLL